ncbi:MAG: iron-sulfur cluster repair di-iron protein [Ignavibacteriaceae bacterium]|jgi:regulator of cell morphogenesis and NO signaling|nr:iron-sulfur cluster repair di-iron protein [Ignavibacteriaceae bacterium]
MNTTQIENIERKTLSEIVTNDFRAAAVFEKYGLDFCCHGKKSLMDAANEKQLSAETIVADLAIVFKSNDSSSLDFNNMELDKLVDYIIKTHHAFVREKLPFITELGKRVVNAHGANHPEVLEIAQLFADVKVEFEGHMFKEERILFPEIKKLAEVKRGSAQYQHPPFGTIANPIRIMETEHENAGSAFDSIKKLSRNYNPPADACNTFKVYYAELENFENDLHKHVHLENNILYPKSLIFEKENQQIK